MSDIIKYITEILDSDDLVSSSITVDLGKNDL